MTREIDDADLTAALRTMIEHTQGVALSAERARQLGRMSVAARAALDAVAPSTLFDTEPADLNVLLDHIEDSPR